MEFYRPPTIQGILDALGCVHRALRAWEFYPPGHPSRKVRTKQAHEALALILDGNDLSLNIGRRAFSLPGGEIIKDVTHISSSLSHEFFIRRVQKITFLHDLSEEDLLDLLRILTLPSDVVQKAGGVEKLLAEHGVSTIWVNVFDLSIINARRRALASTGKHPQSLDEVERGVGLEWFEEPDQRVDNCAELSINEELQALIARLASTTDEDMYLLAARQVITCSDALIGRKDFTGLLALVELLAAHANDPDRAETLRECARLGLERLAMGNELLSYLLERRGEGESISQDAMLTFMVASGPAGISLAAEKMGLTDNLAFRKELYTLLAGLGDAAVSAIVHLMRDDRWYMVRNLSAILGEIGRPEAVPELLHCLQHPDIRVCKEAIRSLAKIGGKDAESALIGVLSGTNWQLFPQVVASLGGMKSRRSLVELMQIVCSDDLLLNNLSLKLDALGAIAMIGDSQVVPLLIQLLRRRHVFARGRWLALRIAIAACLGRLGDTQAVPVLKKFASRSDGLGSACAEAIGVIERTRREQHGDT